MRFSKQIECGCQKALDQDGYSDPVSLKKPGLGPRFHLILFLHLRPNGLIARAWPFVSLNPKPISSTGMAHHHGDKLA
jgi:hypothetical protein